MSDIAKYATTCFVRLGEARKIAEGTRHDDVLHRLTMQAVFVLEDVHETFSRLAERDRQAGEMTRPVNLP